MKGYLMTIGAILAIMVSWASLDLPRPAMISEVSDIQRFSEGTRTIVLLQQKRMLLRNLERIKSRLRTQVGNRDLLEKKADLDFEIQTVNNQLRKLKK